VQAGAQGRLEAAGAAAVLAVLAVLAKAWRIAQGGAAQPADFDSL